MVIVKDFLIFRVQNMSGQNKSEDILAMWSCAGNHGVERIIEVGIKVDMGEKQMTGGKDQLQQGKPSRAGDKSRTNGRQNEKSLEN